MKSKRSRFKLANFLSVLALLAFGFSVLGVSLFRCVFCQEKKLPERILAAEEIAEEKKEMTDEVAPGDEETTEDLLAPTSTPEPVDYYLVYPGILPDHFLYPLKMIRDRMWLLLTTGTKQKAQVMLLFADKRLGAGKALIEGGKQQLGMTTITKGEKYLEQAVDQLKAAKDKDQDIGDLQEKFNKAAAKHEDVLLALKEKVSTEEWGMIDEMVGKTKALGAEIERLEKN